MEDGRTRLNDADWSRDGGRRRKRDANVRRKCVDGLKNIDRT